MIQYLFAGKVDDNIINLDGNETTITMKMKTKNDTPMNLIETIKNGYFQQVRFLIDHGEDLDQRDSQRRTALMLCSFLEPEVWGVGICRMLIENGAKLYFRDIYGMNAFHYACVYERVDLVKVFLKAIDFNLVQGDKQGNTALHYAVKAGNSVIVRLIVQAYVKYRINFDKQNNEGLTALEEAYKYNNRKCIRIIENPEVLTDIGNIDANIPLDLKPVDFEIESEYRSSRKTLSRPRSTLSRPRSTLSRPRSSILSHRSSKSSLLTQTEYSYRRSPTIYSYDTHRYRRKEPEIELSPYEKNNRNIIRCVSMADLRNNPEYLFHLTPAVNDDVTGSSMNVPSKRPRAKSAFVRRSEVVNENQEPSFSWRTELKRLYLHFQYQCTPSYRETVTYNQEAYLPVLDKPLTPANSEHALDEDKTKKGRAKSAVSRQGTQESLSTVVKGKPPVATPSKSSRKISQIIGHGGKIASSADGSLESSSESINSTASSKKFADETRTSKLAKDPTTGRQSRTANYKNIPPVNVEEPHSNTQSPETTSVDTSRLRVIDE